MPLHFSAVKPWARTATSESFVERRQIPRSFESCPGLEWRFPGRIITCFRQGSEVFEPVEATFGAQKCSTTNTNTNHHQQQVSSKSDSQSSKISLQSNNNPKSLKHFLHRSSKSSSSLESSLSLPLLKSSDSKSVAISASHLERSSSSPSSFNGGPSFKQRGVERSYSANVRITPVLNVPVCSLRGSSKSGSVFGFGQLFSSSPQKNPPGTNKGHQTNSNSNKPTDRSH
ncbi:protein RRNAD1-like [Hibiscus syriacus]|uniref:Protein RRNAD1-like n=1 Tax=Hibiscus syriacus TaxID=106335 RepID=A0A6A3AST4_HIBSY|nr:protein RRNAD1-like [Hibiscus syriacus]